MFNDAATKSLQQKIKALVCLKDFQIYSDSVGYLFQLSKPLETGMRSEFKAPTKSAFDHCNDISQESKKLLSYILSTNGVTRIQIWDQYSFTIYTTLMAEPALTFPAFIEAIRTFYGKQEVEFILAQGTGNPMHTRLVDILQAEDPLVGKFTTEILASSNLGQDAAEALAQKLAAITRVSKHIK